MGLDGVGRRGVPAAPTQPLTVEAQSKTKTFQVPNASPSLAPAESVPARALTPSTPLERLRAGDLDREGYLDLQVDDATAHLQGLRPEELEAVRTVLRGQLASDPTLTDLVRQATGEDTK